MPPVDPAATSADEPPMTASESLGAYRSTTSLSPGWTIDEHENGWAVFHCGRQRLLSERKFLKSAGFTRQDAVEYAAKEYAKHKGGS